MVQDEAVGDRVRVLKSLLGPKPPKVLVTSMPALLQPVPSRARLAEQTRTLRTGDALSLDEIARWLVSNGYQNTTAVELPGEFARRGGIIDLYAPDWFQPVRIELFGDEIESIRPFEVESQRSRERLESIDVTAVVGREEEREKRREGEEERRALDGSLSPFFPFPPAAGARPPCRLPSAAKLVPVDRAGRVGKRRAGNIANAWLSRVTFIP